MLGSDNRICQGFPERDGSCARARRRPPAERGTFRQLKGVGTSEPEGRKGREGKGKEAKTKG